MHPYFEEIDFSKYKKMLILLDIDGTITADSKSDIHPKAVERIQELVKENIVYLCTNSFKNDRNEKVASSLNLPLLQGWPRKPSKRVLNKLPKKFLQNKKLVIGDKCLIDGLFAINIGAEFLRVSRKSGHEKLHIKIFNFIDDLVWRMVNF